MSETLKYVVSELNKPPYNKSYNLISFDQLEPLQILQVLTDVLSEVDPKQKVDVREEAADQTAIRIFGILRVLKYKPPTTAGNLSSFRQGLVQGEKPVILPILEWLLQQTPALTKRAYLARYLVKIEVPPEYSQDDQVADLLQQYEILIDEFKDVHKTHETLKNSGFNTADIKKDIASMEEEKEQLGKRVERLKRKVENTPNTGPMLAAAQNLRRERDRDTKLTQQKQEQKGVIAQFEQRCHRLQHQLKETRQSSIGATPEGLLQRLEEENKINTYMLKDKLPKQLGTTKSTVQDLQRVVAEPAMGQSDLDEINNKIKQTNAEVNQLVEKRMMSGDPMEDKLSLFRQQVAIIARKKEAAAESLREVREEHAKLESEQSSKKDQLKQNDGEEVLKGEEFKRYVNKLRSKSTVFKKKRQELAELRAEAGVMSRTEEILKGREDTMNRQLGQLENQKGVSGYRETQDALESVSALKSELDSMKGKTLEDISVLVQKLNRRIQEKKSALAPLIKELRPLRQKAQEMQSEHDDKKSQYDTMAAGLESNRSKLEQEVRGLREECSGEESRFHYVNTMKHINNVQQKKIADEMKSYMSSDSTEKRKAFRDLYSKKILEQENLGKGLREKQKYVRENHDGSMVQMRMWRDVQRIMESKLGVKSHGDGGGTHVRRSVSFAAQDEERLIL